VTLYFPMTYHFLLPLTVAGVTVLIYPNQKIVTEEIIAGSIF
jgi:uncharacterized membrane protein